MSDENNHETPKTENGSKKKGEKTKTVINYNALLPDFLRLVPDDVAEVPSPPDITGCSPIEAGKKMGDYYRTLASLHSGTTAKNKARTRAMIILGAVVSQHASPSLQIAIRELVAEHAAPRDLGAVREVVAWLAQPRAPQ
jgi:hypothetical protein